MKPPRRVRKHVNPLSVRKEVAFEGFGNTNPIVVDIGSNKGEFALALREHLPTHNLILCEIRLPMAAYLREITRDMDNVVVFDGDAGRNFASLIRPSLDTGARLDTVYVNFPDPWVKDRHKKRRFITSEFLESIADWFPADAVFVFQTDQAGLYQDTQDIIDASSGFQVMNEFDQPPHDISTHWESVKVAEGMEIYRMVFGRRENWV